MKAQEDLKQQLDTVGQDVESARSDVAEVHTDLNKLGDNMYLLQQQQTYTSEGIYVLCRQALACSLTQGSAWTDL